MQRILSEEAKKHLLGTPSLYADVCMLLGVKPTSLSQLVYRDRKCLTTHDVVMAIAKNMGVKSNEVLALKVSNKLEAIKS